MKNRLKELREESGLTQKELAHKLNLSKPTISKYEDGSVDMSTQTLDLCAQLFDCSIDYLLYRTDVRKIESKENSDRLIKELKDYDRAFKLAKDSSVSPDEIEAQLLLWKRMREKKD